MANNCMNLKMSELSKQITLYVKLSGIREFKFRLWVGRQLIKLAAKIMRMGIEFNA